MSMPTKRVIRLHNLNCPYCGCSLEDDVAFDMDHVIGRRFVPRGTFQGCWNLHLNACRPCNSAKGDLEDDISAITMQPDILGRYACDDDRLYAEAARKARNSLSRMTRKPVVDSKGSMTIRGRMGPMTMTMNFVSLPQVDEHRLFDLARRQLQGIYFLQTYDHQAQRGHFWPGSFYPLAIAHKGDWGRERMRWFEDITRSWDVRWGSVAADGFHKVWTRKFDAQTSLWAWAMEWNRNYRLVGFFGEREPLMTFNDRIPPEDTTVFHTDGGGTLVSRTEVPLSEKDDRLFDFLEEIIDQGDWV